MKKIKRIVACFCVCVLLATAPTTAYAKANTINSGALVEVITTAICSTPHGALVAVLALVGITGTAYVYDNRENIEKFAMDMYDRAERWFEKMADKVSVTWNQFENWLGDVANGALDTSSECWDAFKDFCTDLVKQTASGSDVAGTKQIQIGDVTLQVGTVGWSSNINDFTAVNVVLANTKTQVDLGNVPENWAFGFYPSMSNAADYIKSSQAWCWWEMDSSRKYDAGSYDVKASWRAYSKESCPRLGVYYYDFTDTSCSAIMMNTQNNSDKIVTRKYTENLSFVNGRISNVPVFKSLAALEEYVNTGTIKDWTQVNTKYLPLGYTFTDVFEMVIGHLLPTDGSEKVQEKEDVSDIVVAPDTDRVIDRDGNLDNVGVADVTGVIDGTISIPIDGVDGVSISNPYEVIDGVYPVDTIDGTILGTDTPIDGITPVNPSGGHDYTIPNLQELFPFCIPWDLVSLFKTLKADPEAPCFKFPLPVPKKDGGFTYKYIEIDLSDFNSVAKVLRTMELLAFCVGLTLATRNLIRG